MPLRQQVIQMISRNHVGMTDNDFVLKKVMPDRQRDRQIMLLCQSDGTQDIEDIVFAPCGGNVFTLESEWPSLCCFLVDPKTSTLTPYGRMSGTEVQCQLFHDGAVLDLRLGQYSCGHRCFPSLLQNREFPVLFQQGVLSCFVPLKKK